MPNLRDIRRRIDAVKSTKKITSAMKMVATAQLRRAQNAIWAARPYVQKLEATISNLLSSVGDSYSHELIRKPKEIKNITVIAVAADRGLCGGFNSQLFKAVYLHIEENLKQEYPDAEISVIPVGKRTVGYFKKREYPRIKDFLDVFTGLNFSTAKDITDIAKFEYVNGGADLVQIYYNEFVNVIKQVPKLETLLPVQPKEAIKDDEVEDDKFSVDYIFEPSQSAILDTLLPKFVDIQMWRALLESNAAEQAARRMAMENATDNATELITELELQFNKARQAAITNEMLEIVSGANALKDS